jgi:hypothetical protein
MIFKSRVDGLGDLSRALSRLADSAELNEALLATAEDVRSEARANLNNGAPPETRTGNLARSIFAEIDSSGNARIGTPLDYGWHLEHGSSTLPAYPWLEPALQARRETLILQIRRWLESAARRSSR